MSSSPPLLGRVAVAAKVLTMEQLAQATRHQARVAPDKALGDIFQELGFMDRATLERVLEMQARLVEKARAKKQHYIGNTTNAHCSEALTGHNTDSGQLALGG